MIRTQRVTVTREEDKVVDILCNRCGESLGVDTGGGHRDYYGLGEVQVSGGYASPVLPDAMTFTFSLCEPCLGQLFSTFKIQPATGDELFECGRVNGKWVNGRYVLAKSEEGK